KTKMGPMIKPPSGDLETALKELEPGESWAVMPRPHPKNGNIYTPGVKWGVQPGSFTHKTEFFGPVLGVMKAANIHEAIQFVNATGFGLTSGIESLDIRECEIWRDSIRAGNLYINRGTTGAIVLRQPFGGMGKSAVGPGIKAGGPNYVAQLMNFTEDVSALPTSGEIADDGVGLLVKSLAGCSMLDDSQQSAMKAAALNYAKYQREEFGKEHDHFRLVGQDNFRRYLPVREIRIRVHAADSPFEIFSRICAAKTVGSRITVSVPDDLGKESTASRFVDWIDSATDAWAAAIEFVVESDRELADAIRSGNTLRVRYASADRVPTTIREAAAKVGLYIADTPVMASGRLELLWYVEEQSISDNYHRYGNLGERASEERAPVA
ncbi:MAG: aldehyde dehydrogenase family protein, partial [Planctomycetota bacterium]